MAVMGSFFDVIKCDKIYLLRLTDLQKDRKCNYVTDLDKELETEILSDTLRILSCRSNS
jgi:hypothetical protein